MSCSIAKRSFERSILLDGASAGAAIGAIAVFGGCAALCEPGRMQAVAIASADSLYDDAEFVEAVVVLRKALELAPECPDIVWRLARCIYQTSQMADVSLKEKKHLVDEAYELIEKALEMDPDNYKIHSWYGILLQEKGTLEGTKAKIAVLMKVKESWKKAVELNARDSTSLHLLGRWCYGITEIDWFSRNIARALFGKLPDTNYEEALMYFMKSENIAPGKWKKNAAMIAFCQLRLGKKEEAKAWFEKALKVPIKTEEDRKTHAEVMKELKLN